MSKTIITLEFDDLRPIGVAYITEDIIGPDQLHEYVLAPSSQYNHETKQFDFLGWGLVHRTHIHPEYAEAMKAKEEEWKS